MTSKNEEEQKQIIFNLMNFYSNQAIYSTMHTMSALDTMIIIAVRLCVPGYKDGR